jgi:hypothetical protein
MAKKKTEKVEDLKLNFTGKASLVLELEDFGPMEFNFNDKQVVYDVVKLLIDNLGEISNVDAYDKKTEKSFRNLLDRIS